MRANGPAILGRFFPADNLPLSADNLPMTDPRFQKLARLLVEYSTALKKGDHVLLDMIDVPDESR